MSSAKYVPPHMKKSIENKKITNSFAVLKTLNDDNKKINNTELLNNKNFPSLKKSIQNIKPKPCMGAWGKKNDAIFKLNTPVNSPTIEINEQHDPKESETKTGFTYIPIKIKPNIKRDIYQEDNDEYLLN